MNERRVLCEKLQELIGLLSQADNENFPNPHAWLLLGNPDAEAFFSFAAQWKKQKKNIPIVLAGGRGRGTIPLILNIAKHLSSGEMQMKEKWLNDLTILETDLLEFILNKMEVPASMIFKEKTASKNSTENFTQTQPILADLVKDQAQPVIGIVTSPPLLLRAQTLAKKTWNHSWQVIRWKTYQMSASMLDDNGLIALCGYLIGYSDEWVSLYPELNSRNELSGYQALGGTVNREDWEKLETVKAAFKLFLSKQELTYDENTKNLICKER